MLRWTTFGLLAAGGMGIISQHWQVALCALPGFVIELAQSRREEA